MADNGNGLTSRQKRAIAAPLTEEDAKAARVGARSVYRRLDDPAFLSKLQKAEATLLAQLIAGPTGLTEKSANVRAGPSPLRPGSGR